MKVYVSGPYTKGDTCVNTHRAVAAGNQLLDCGHAPFVPHLSHFWHTMTPRSYEDWMFIDLAFLATCDAVIRLSGESSGADREVARAHELGIPVYNSVVEFTMSTDKKTCEYVVERINEPLAKRCEALGMKVVAHSAMNIALCVNPIALPSEQVTMCFKSWAHLDGWIKGVIDASSCVQYISWPPQSDKGFIVVNEIWLREALRALGHKQSGEETQVLPS